MHWEECMECYVVQVRWHEVVVVLSDGEEVRCWLYDSLRAWKIQCRERQVRSIEQWYVHEWQLGITYTIDSETENHIRRWGSQ